MILDVFSDLKHSSVFSGLHFCFLLEYFDWVNNFKVMSLVWVALDARISTAWWESGVGSHLKR